MKLELRLPPSFRVGEYAFESSDARERFRKGTEVSTGGVILWELHDTINRVGYDVRKPEHSRSKYRPEMLKLPLEKYFTAPTQNYDAKLLFEATRKVGRAFYVGKLKPLELEKVVYDPLKQAGAPTFYKKGEVYPEELKRARRIRRGEAPPPVTVYHRGKNDDVARPVFGFPFSVTLLEGRFFHPYQREVIRHHNPYVGGRSYPQLSGEVNELRWKSDYVVELDYSGFDGSISAKLIHNAFEVIKNCFEMTEEDEKDWAFIVKYFITCPVLLPGGVLVKGKRHGVPSGSMFTQLIDSIVNAIAIEYACMRSKIVTTRYHVMGDDSIIGVRGKRPTLTQFGRCAAELGLAVNLEKSQVRRVSERCYFLGHYWNWFYGTRDFSESWEKILTPERPDVRFFSKDRKVRYQAYVERLRAYQDDNPAMFGEVQLVINALTGLPRCDIFTYSFRRTLASEDRFRWDLALQHMSKRTIIEKPFSRHLYQLGASSMRDTEAIS